MLDAFDYFLVVFCLTAIGKEFHKSDIEMSLSITITLAFRPVGAFVFGLLADRYGRRLPLMLDLMFYSVVEVATGFAHTYTQFMVLRALGGANQTQLAGDDARLARRIGGQRAKLQKQAFKFGKKLYRKKPRSFAMRIKRGFDTPPKTTKTRNHHSANGLNKLNKMQFANLHPARYLHTS